jgi:hypothetical protein
MVEEKYLEAKFRIGATHGGEWLWEEAKRMAKGGSTSQEIAERLDDLVQVLGDWRTNWTNPTGYELPNEGNPWEWKREELDGFIAQRKSQW